MDSRSYLTVQCRFLGWNLELRVGLDSLTCPNEGMYKPFTRVVGPSKGAAD